MSDQDRFVDPSREAFDAFKLRPRGCAIEMLNMVRFREWAAYPADHPAAGERISGAQAYKSYAEESAPIFARVGGTIVWSAVPELILIGPPDELWDTTFVAHYPTAAAFLEMVTDEAYRRAVVHRQAAVETSRLIRTVPRPRPEAQSFG